MERLRVRMHSILSAMSSVPHWVRDELLSELITGSQRRTTQWGEAIMFSAWLTGGGNRPRFGWKGAQTICTGTGLTPL